MKTEVEAADNLMKAADILEVGGWCQFTLYDDRGRHCALGAIESADHGDDRSMWRDDWSTNLEIGAVANVLGVGSLGSPNSAYWDAHWVAEWNNAPERTAGGVICALRQAAFNLNPKLANIGREEEEIEVTPIYVPAEQPSPAPAPSPSVPVEVPAEEPVPV